ncbi:MAG TPA: lipid kinase, partial [Clostridiales bacterium]|nr:lipid kinase [Clostridiales bacterium]
MKYVFIINLSAGNNLAEKSLEKELVTLKESIEYEKHVTRAPKEATKFVKEYCENSKEEICFVACGGDGTINEVVSGLIGQENKYFAVLPYGSGNDFVKYYPNSNFLSLSDLINGEKLKIDLLKVNDSYCVNMCNIGLEAVVGAEANRV